MLTTRDSNSQPRSSSGNIDKEPNTQHIDICDTQALVQQYDTYSACFTNYYRDENGVLYGRSQTFNQGHIDPQSGAFMALVNAPVACFDLNYHSARQQLRGPRQFFVSHQMTWAQVSEAVLQDPSDATMLAYEAGYTGATPDSAAPVGQLLQFSGTGGLHDSHRDVSTTVPDNRSQELAICDHLQNPVYAPQSGSFFGELVGMFAEAILAWLVPAWLLNTGLFGSFRLFGTMLSYGIGATSGELTNQIIALHHIHFKIALEDGAIASVTAGIMQRLHIDPAQPTRGFSSAAGDTSSMAGELNAAGQAVQQGSQLLNTQQLLESAMTQNLIRQSMLMAMGRQHGFDWRSLSAAVMAVPMDGEINHFLPDPTSINQTMARAMLRNINAQLGQAIQTRRINLAIMIQTTISDTLSGGLQQKYENEQAEARKSAKAKRRAEAQAQESARQGSQHTLQWGASDAQKSATVNYARGQWPNGQRSDDGFGKRRGSRRSSRYLYVHHSEYHQGEGATATHFSTTHTSIYAKATRPERAPSSIKQQSRQQQVQQQQQARANVDRIGKRMSGRVYSAPRPSTSHPGFWATARAARQRNETEFISAMHRIERAGHDILHPHDMVSDVEEAWKEFKADPAKPIFKFFMGIGTEAGIDEGIMDDAFSSEIGGQEDFVDPTELNFSQSSVSRFKVRTDPVTGRKITYSFDDIVQGMKEHGWQGSPVNVVKMADGSLTTIDNSRVLAARQAGIEAHIKIWNYDAPISERAALEYTARGKSVPSTWGEAIHSRISIQEQKYFQDRIFAEMFGNGSIYDPLITGRGFR